ncbi:saccharopine dehydrogenase NADP-binding domain-containing protein [Marinobacter salexigens]|uniref:Saccharopine dehydrogenase NADP-binding domain-containing protein n=1 Tax=Marinobacter salexigens TaxID=1925763 RepID=A0ABS6A733_9GAMM|nr:saccharopine dehydrogenase NADP-binding domain-containing protein [Marinobacter salexigens]MBU2873594.1 saccharopine dehydrogenase NADP-binding domain-containing protein [Marinobacter salexigens]
MPDSVLLAGGYGIVGTQLATMLSQRHPNNHLIIGGRSLERAQMLVSTLPNASAITLNTDDSDPLANVQETPHLVVSLTNDSGDKLLSSCLRRNIPYLDITRWTERVRHTVAVLPALQSMSSLTSPVVFASSWMAAVAATLARGASMDMVTDSITIDVLYGMNDKAGPNSAEYMDRLELPFEVMEGGLRKQKKSFTDERLAHFQELGDVAVYRFDAPDQLTLPAITGANSVSTRIAFSSVIATRLLKMLIRSGIWRAISGDQFTFLRRAILYNPGTGDHHRISIEVVGRESDSSDAYRRLEVDDPEGQTHLTAVGALIQVDRILGLNGHISARAGAQYAEAETDPALLRSTLEEFGVTVRDFHSRPGGYPHKNSPRQHS